MLLSLKILVLDDDKKAFRSPVVSRNRMEYLWSADRKMVAECDKCQPMFSGEIGDNCTCGLYSSPNFEAIAEYDNGKYAVICLLNLYGKVDIWYGPEGKMTWAYQTYGDLRHTFICRSWGARIVAVVDRSDDTGMQSHDRNIAMTTAAEILNVPVFGKGLATAMIDKTWMDTLGYKPERKE